MPQLTPNEKRDIIKYLEEGKPLPDKYRFLLFKENREVELAWNGKTNEVANLVLPFQTIEQIDEPRSEKEIEAQGGLKLIYIVPPFDVGADFSMDIKIGDEEFTKKPSVIEEIAYRDTWGKGADSFIAMIYERLKLMHGLLAEDGSIYVHCDWRVSAYVKLALDEIFGIDNFQNEIIWAYEGSSRPRKAWDKKHETILMYSKSEKVIFNAAAVGDQKKESSMKAYEANMMEDEGGKFI